MKATLYPALVQLAAHGQENKSITLYNFSMFNTILVLAWATVFVNTDAVLEAVVSTAICILGAVSCFAWNRIGADYADASDLFGRQAEALEALLPPDVPKPLTERRGQLNAKWQKRTAVGSRTLLTWIPAGMGLLYALFAVASWVAV